MPDCHPGNMETSYLFPWKEMYGMDGIATSRQVGVRDDIRGTESKVWMRSLLQGGMANGRRSGRRNAGQPQCPCGYSIPLAGGCQPTPGPDPEEGSKQFGNPEDSGVWGEGHRRRGLALRPWIMSFWEVARTVYAHQRKMYQRGGATGGGSHRERS